MNIILLERTENLGELGDTVSVKPGYGRNFLIPRKKAVVATPDNIALFEAMRAELEKQQTDVLARAQARAENIQGCVLTIPVKAGDEGRLFGSVGSRDIVDAAKAMDLDIDREEVRMQEGSIRQIGEHEVTIRLHPDVEVTITVSTVPE